MTEELKEFRKAIDEDSGLSAKRKQLTVASLILISLNLSSAKIEEANTFLFKLSFQNHNGILLLLGLSIGFLLLRYYGYAQEYHNKLFSFWSNRMLNDWRVLSHDQYRNVPAGLLGRKIDVYLGDTPEVMEGKYEASFPFIRKISYVTEESCGDTGEPEELINYIHLNQLNDQWKLRHFLMLLAFEFQYQAGALIRFRESLDLLAPYAVGLFALISICLR